MNELEQLKKENAELKSKIFNISKAWRLASSDISALFETQPMNRNDGSYDIDDQSCHELYLAIDKTPEQHLADIKADAVIELSQYEMTVARLHDGTKRSFVFASDINKYANKLRSES